MKTFVTDKFSVTTWDDGCVRVRMNDEYDDEMLIVKSLWD